MRRKYLVSISAAAQGDIRRIQEFIARDKPRAASKWLREIRRNVSSLSFMPLRMPLIPEADELPVDYRQLLFGKYRIIFELDDDSVTILRVLHGARQLDSSFFEQA